MTPSEIEPASFRLVAHGLNYLRHRHSGVNKDPANPAAWRFVGSGRPKTYRIVKLFVGNFAVNYKGVTIYRVAQGLYPIMWVGGTHTCVFFPWHCQRKFNASPAVSTLYSRV